MDHKGKDTHLSSTPIVEFNSELLFNGCLIPTRCLELGSLDLFFFDSVTNLNNTNEGGKLRSPRLSDDIKCMKTRGDFREGGLT